MKRQLPFMVALTLCLAGCATHHPQEFTLAHDQVDYTKYVSVAAISTDSKLAKRLDGILQSAGITSIIEGSVVYGISVPPDKRAQAIEVLKKDAELNKYWIEF